MWQIIKAEISYLSHGQIFLMIPAVITVLTLLYNDANIINLSIYMSSLIIVANIFGIKSKEKRTHKDILLPVTRATVAHSRCALITIPTTLLLITGLILQLSVTGYHEQWYDGVYELIMLSGLVFFMGHLYLLISDSYSLLLARSNKIIFHIVVFTLLILLMILFSVSIKNIFYTSLTAGIILIMFLIGSAIFIAAATVNSYSKREILSD